jgi:aryl-alcohol dehydrogenase-like predicted oxidoreductase
MPLTLSRRDFSAAAGITLLGFGSAGHADDALRTRAIPSSGERLPMVGLGTADVFDRDDEATRRAATEVVRALLESGGRIVDTASSYGDAESVLGNVSAAAGRRDRLFIATKVEALDANELKRSLTRLKTTKVDLLQLHNVRDATQSLAQLKAWKAQGRCRYVGVTSTYHRDFAAIEAVLRREKPDFVQIDYSLDDRAAQERILPAAADNGAAVLTALPFGRGRLFQAVRGKEIPDWAKGFAASWSQFFLKYLLADERVTATIPGTSNPAHMIDNAGAMRGSLPDAAERAKMVAFVATL